MSQRVKKAIIPVAGFGTRFLPATKAMPKEMLPIIDKPVIQYVVEEAVASGIEDVILVTSHAKRPVENHFDHNEELEHWLRRNGKERALKDVRAIGELANFIYVRQKGAYGNATPVLNCRHLIGDEPFAVFWADETFTAKTPRLKQMIETYQKYQDPVLGCISVDDEGTEKYGIVDPASQVEKNVWQVKGVVEKPGPKAARSRLASIGTYILTPDIFDAIEETKPDKSGEIVLLNAIFTLMKKKKRPVYAHQLEGTWYDTGSKIGWLKANIALALEREDLKKDVKAMLRGLR